MCFYHAIILYGTTRDTGLASPSSLLVKELFSPVNVIASSLLVTKLVRLTSDGGKFLISNNAHISVNIWTYEKFDIVEQSGMRYEMLKNAISLLCKYTIAYLTST